MPPEFGKNNDINKTLEQSPKVVLSAGESAKNERKKLENDLLNKRKLEKEKLRKKINKAKEKLGKNYKKGLEELEYREAVEKIDKYGEKLRQLGETKKEVETYIKQDTEKKLSSFVKEFKNDLSGITKIYENKKLFGDSFKIFTALLREKKNNELGEKIYDAFATNSDIAGKLEYYLEKGVFKINNIQDIEKLLKILNSPKKIKDKKNESLEKNIENNDRQELDKYLENFVDYKIFKEKYNGNIEKIDLDKNKINKIFKILIRKASREEKRALISEKKKINKKIENFKKQGIAENQAVSNIALGK